MHVIEVIPLRRGVTVESLSYFSSVAYDPGTFLSVPVRGKQMLAVVVESQAVSSTKTALKAASFSLRKLPAQEDATPLPQPVLDTANALTKEIPARLGAILFALLPPDVINGSVRYPYLAPHHAGGDSTPSILQATTAERYVTYRSYIRSTFAHRGSVLLVVPTAVEVAFAAQELHAGIDERMVIFSPDQTKKERTAAYTAFTDTSTAKLIITTPAFAYLDRPDLMAIIVERSGSSHYRQRTRPYLDHRQVLKTYAAAAGRQILLGDTLVSPEDEAKRREEIYQTHGEHPKRLSIKSKFSVVEQTEKPTSETPFQLFSGELMKMIENTLARKGKVFLYAARRGLAPLVVCFDCGFIFRCPDSGAPFSLTRTVENGEEKRWFVCATSGTRVPAADLCEQCGSWRLRERGIGIQQVADTFAKTFPDQPFLLLDQESANTYKKARQVASDFYAQKGAVLIGTNMALPFLQHPIDASAVLSVDAARAVPTWRTDEYFFSLLLKLREVSQTRVLVQTRSAADDLLTYASRGAVERFYDDELKLREMVKYPPTSVFILLTWQGNARAVQVLESRITELLKPHTPLYYSRPTLHDAKVVRHGLLRLPATTWPDQALVDALRRLPPQVKIELNPDRIV